mmetsp:Transcript_5836/g.16390  ORF Transcript_5836/g.16390 Transcript_5836/m.16390 type:complete len:98 (-) Transcript_5836:466-759(-)
MSVAGNHGILNDGSGQFEVRDGNGAGRVVEGNQLAGELRRQGKAPGEGLISLGKKHAAEPGARGIRGADDVAGEGGKELGNASGAVADVGGQGVEVL